MKKYLKVILVAFAIAILIAGIGWSIYLAFGDKLFEYSTIIKFIADAIK